MNSLGFVSGNTTLSAVEVWNITATRSTTNNSDNVHRFYNGPVEFAYFTVVILCVEAFAGAILNILTILSMVKFNKLWTPPNMLIISLSASDCLPLLARVFTVAEITFVHRDKDIWIGMCYAQAFITIVSHGANVSLISTIAVERALSIFAPIWSRNNVTIHSVQMISTIVWVCDIFVVTIQFCFGRKPRNEVHDKCKWEDILKSDTIVYTMQPGFIVSSLVTLLTYLAIIWKARRMKNQVNPAQRENKQHRKQLKINKMMGTVVGLYYALYLPAITEAQIDYDKNVKFYITRIVLFLFYANSICNPIVYVWQNRHFKEAFLSQLAIPNKGERSLQQETTDKHGIETTQD